MSQKHTVDRLHLGAGRPTIASIPTTIANWWTTLKTGRPRLTNGLRRIPCETNKVNLTPKVLFEKFVNSNNKTSNYRHHSNSTNMIKSYLQSLTSSTQIITIMMTKNKSKDKIVDDRKKWDTIWCQHFLTFKYFLIVLLAQLYEIKEAKCVPKG